MEDFDLKEAYERFFGCDYIANHSTINDSVLRFANRVAKEHLANKRAQMERALLEHPLVNALGKDAANVIADYIYNV